MNLKKEIIRVWQGVTMPGHAADQAESGEVSPEDGVLRFANVSDPTLELYHADGAGKKPAVIVCPGGGYHHLAYSKEGMEIAEWLNGQGISAFVLKYRVPDNQEGALQDLQRAIRIVRFNADQWGIDPAKVGVIGFSAGANLAVRSTLFFRENSYAPIDPLDTIGVRPDFAMLIYPAYFDENGQRQKLRPEYEPAGKDIPPTFMAHSKDDSALCPGTELYDAALTAAGIPHETHIWNTGGHGYGLQCKLEAKGWSSAAETWLKKIC